MSLPEHVQHPTPHGKQALPQITFPPRKNRPCFICYDTDFIAGHRRYGSGVYWHATKKGKDAAGNEIEELVNTWICSVLKVLSIVRTNAGAEHSYLLEYIPHGENEPRRALLPQSHLLGRAEEALKALRDVGVSVLYEHAKEVRDYLDKEHRRFSAENPDDFWQSVKTIGWAPPPKSFILPNETLGNHSHVWFSGHCKPSLYAKVGTFEEWKANVAEPCENNAYLLLGVSTAFAGPLLELLNIPGFGFHLYGDSTSGKTTVLAASCSARGSPDLLLSWATTINGLESQAVSRSSTIICLDESHQVDPKVLDGSVYMLANGVSKSRMTKEIVARDLAHWRLPILSSGERAIETHLGAARIAFKVGQGIRLADIPVRGIYGIFDDIHEEQSGSVFADKLRDAARDHYGHAGPAFVERLIEKLPDISLSDMLAEIMEDFGAGLNAQEIRVARAFALAALAGELAVEWEIVPWPANQPRIAAKEIFDIWRASQPQSPKGKEYAQIITGLRDFIEVHGADFSDADWTPDYDSNNRIVNPEPVIRERAGYWEDLPSGKRIYLFNADGLKRASSGFKRSRVAEALLDAKAIVDSDPGRHTKKRWISELKQRFDFYLVDPEKLELDP